MAIELSNLTFTEQDDVVPASGVEKIFNTGIANTLAGDDIINGESGNSIGGVGAPPPNGGIFNTGTLNTDGGNDRLLDGQFIQIEKAAVSDSGGFEGSQKSITLDSNGGGVVSFRYEHFTIPDNFIIRYESKNILETGFVGGSRSGTVQIPKGNSNQLEVIVATDDEGTLWNYSVETLNNGLSIQDAYVAVEGRNNQTATIKFPVTLSEASDAETTVHYVTLVGTAVDGDKEISNNKADYKPITGTVTFAPGEIKKEIEIAVLSDNPINFGSNENFEIFARDTAYRRNWKEGEDVDNKLLYKDTE